MAVEESRAQEGGMQRQILEPQSWWWTKKRNPGSRIESNIASPQQHGAERRDTDPAPKWKEARKTCWSGLDLGKRASLLEDSRLERKRTALLSLLVPTTSSPDPGSQCSGIDVVLLVVCREHAQGRSVEVLRDSKGSPGISVLFVSSGSHPRSLKYWYC